MSILDSLLKANSTRLEVGDNTTGATTTTIGTAASDSENGEVLVVLPGTVIPADLISGSVGSEAVPLPCLNSCKEGDSVYISLVGNDTIKTPYVIGPIGWGDALEARVKALEDGGGGGAGGDGLIIHAREYENQPITYADFPRCTSIEEYAFNGCSSLTTVNFPKVTSLARNVFFGCRSLLALDLPEATTIGAYAFANCSSLVSADLPKVTTIEADGFQSCESLTTLNVPSLVNLPNTSSGQGAFHDCSALTEVDLPSIMNIGVASFRNCTALSVIDLYSPTRTNIPALGNNAIDGTLYYRGGIFINDELVNTLKAASGWNDYAAHIFPESEKSWRV